MSWASETNKRDWEIEEKSIEGKKKKIDSSRANWERGREERRVTKVTLLPDKQCIYVTILQETRSLLLEMIVFQCHCRCSVALSSGKEQYSPLTVHIETEHRSKCRMCHSFIFFSSSLLVHVTEGLIKYIAHHKSFLGYNRSHVKSLQRTS